jgi:holliday junction DNA helicase RuvA
MFNSLTGKLSGHSFPQLLLETGGLEWQVEVSATTFQAALAADRNAPVRLLVYLQVREDILKLFGFWTEAERQVFLELITVSGIGPRQALRILSGTTVRELTTLLEAEDVPALTRIPGLGTKTAQKMILQLKGHLVLDDPAGAGNTLRGSGPLEELLTALVEMGFDRSGARTVLERLRDEIVGDTVPAEGRSASELSELQEREIFRRAIQELSR